MNNHLITAFSVGLLGSALALGGCSSSDDSPAPGATVPANAKTITATNAPDTVTEAIGIGTSVLDAAGAVEITQTPTAMDIINMVEDIVENRSSTSSLNLPTGVTDTFDCFVSGTITYTYTETATSESGSVTFVNCDDGFGAGVINGKINYSDSWNNDTGAYTQTANGSVTINISGLVITFSGLNFNQTGNFISYDYTINTFTYSISSTLSNTGYLAQVTAPITGNELNSCPDSGQVTVTGASNTKARGTISGSFVIMEYNDGTSWMPASPSSVSCSSIFQ